MNSSPTNHSFDALLDYLKISRGFDFNAYKRPSLMRRMYKRMQMVKIEKFGDYVDYLEVHPEEFIQLFNTILINVTSFFRDQAAWEFLAQKIVPRVLEEKGEHDPVRVWSAGCASGEEPYSIAILLAEAMGPESFHERVKIYATDVDEEALVQARQASYSTKVLEPLSEELRQKYFESSNNQYTFRGDLRRSVIFGRHDLVQDAPISHVDLLVCRNTIMYFNAETQGHVLARFHYALNDRGFLFLGRAEMLLTHAGLFTPAELKYRIFTRIPKAALRDRLPVLPQPGAGAEVGNHLIRQVRLREAAFDSGPVANLVVDLNGNLVMANERARSLFGLGIKDLSRPFQDLEVSYRPVELRSLIEQCYRENRCVNLQNVEKPLPDGTMKYLDIMVAALKDNGGEPLGVAISFNDSTSYRQLQNDLQRHQQELETAYEELQSTNEELETTNEELQSSNEELETTNEELQSSNEELETMNEELQSTNEELQTTNEQLRQRTDELNQANAFLQSILGSLHQGVAVLDPRLNILAWNHRAEDLWGLRADEVRGQSFLNLEIGLPVENLKGLIRSCLTKDIRFQDESLEALTRRGKKIQCRVTCSAIIGSDKQRLGVILMMEEQDSKKNNMKKK